MSIQELEATIDRYVKAVIWLTENESDPRYEKCLHELEKLEDKLRELGLSNEEIGDLIDGAKQEVAKKVEETAQSSPVTDPALKEGE